jgi:hypothetical protein
MILEEYIKQNYSSYADFGKNISTSRDLVRKWCKNMTIPNKKNMQKIQYHTNGFVKATDFYDYNPC